MQRFSDIFSRFVIKFRWLFIILCLITTVFFINTLKNLSFQTNLGDFAPQKHPYMLVQNELTRIFGGLNQVSIAIERKEGDIFNYQTLSKVDRITRKLYLMDGINAGRVVSLSARKVKNVIATPEGFISDYLMRYPPQTREGLAKLRIICTRNPLIYGVMVSKDLKSTLIQADFESSVSSKRIFEALNQIVKPEQDPDTKIYIAGRPILEGWLNFYLPKMGKVFLGTLVLMIVVLFIAFRSKRGIILPLASSLMAVSWGLGSLALLGFSLNPATILVPFLILALGISHSVQFIKRYYEEVKQGLKSRPAALITLKELFIPASSSLLTDGIGFLSLLIIPLVMIKSMAIASGIGVLSIFFTTITFIPAVLSFLPRPKKIEIEREEKFTIVNRVLSGISGLIQHRFARWTIIGLFLVLALIGLKGASQLVVGDNEPGSAILYPNSPYNLAESFVNEQFSGSNPYYVFIKGDKQDSLLDSGVLREMESLQRYLRDKIPQMGYSLSLVDYIKGLNSAMFGGDRNYFVIPKDSRTIAEYLFLYYMSSFPGDFDPVVSPDYRFANLKVDLKDHKSTTIKNIITATESWVKEHHHNKAVEFHYAGGDIGIMAAINQIISRVLPLNIIQVSVLVFLCISVAYGSIAAGGLILLPLGFSILLTFGIMGMLGITLTVETLPLAALGIGLGVDYGIYVVSRFKREYSLNNNLSLKEIAYKSLVTSGKAVFFTCITVAIGVFSWLFSDIRLQARLGLALGSLLILNMLGALILLPCLISIIKPRFIFKKSKVKG
ncbi:MAG: MMPL family transporter [Candidatus Omnitrophota bacterium]|nr:MMPL family transporter [Candidatus Omnitrophota bacterium]